MLLDKAKVTKVIRTSITAQIVTIRFKDGSIEKALKGKTVKLIGEPQYSLTEDLTFGDKIYSPLIPYGKDVPSGTDEKMGTGYNLWPGKIVSGRIE